MKKLFLFTVLVFITLSNLVNAQTNMKNYVWEEIGLKYDVPSFVQVIQKSNVSLGLESENFLIYIELVEEFDEMSELMEYYEVKEIVKMDFRVDKPSYSGKMALGIVDSIEDGDALDTHNFFGNFQSKFNKKEKIAIDISTYEWNPEMEEYLNNIINSIEFYSVGNSSKNKDTVGR